MKPVEKPEEWKVNKTTAQIKDKVVEGTAISIRKNDQGLWQLVEVEFNVLTGYTNISKVTTLTEHKGSAIHAYLVRSVNLKHSVP